MAEEETITPRTQLVRKYKQLRRHKHPLNLEFEVNGQKIDPFGWIKHLQGGRDDEEIRDHEEHKHTLILNEEHKYDGEKFPSCYLCEELILGPCYSCSNSSLLDHECGYYLHKSCAEATPTMHHPIHPQHPLIFSLGSWQICDSCRGTLKDLLIYCCCKNCDFYLDMKCAFSLLEHKIVNTSIHKHPLISLGREALLLCDACLTKHQGFFYVCTTCMESGASFFIHRSCVLLPRAIKHRDHHHILSLSYSFPTQYSQFYPTCKICSEWLHPKYWIYSCVGCRYSVHVHCAKLVSTKTSKEGESSKQEEETSKMKPRCETDTNITYVDPEVTHLPLPDESISLVSHFIKQMTLEDKNGERITELEHYSHNHPLILHEVQSKYNMCSTLSSFEKNNEICNICTKPIMNSPFYNCAQCNFSLHEFCAELPTEVRYPGHPQHSLILRAKASTFLCWPGCYCCQRRCSILCIKCKHCSPISDDYAFYCASCEFFIHIKCALSPGAITHERHPQHVLLLNDEIDWRGENLNNCYCNACGNAAITGSAFECNTCSFKLHILCAYLPRRVEHRYDKHPFILTYSPLEDHPDEYLCEICEKEVDPEYWFYHCAVCDQSLHIDCIT